MSDDSKVDVLVVDDNADLAESIGDLLDAKGYRVRVAFNGQQALAMIDVEVPHCVILDVWMPKLDGRAFAKQLRATFKDDIVLIGISGYDAESPEVRETFELVDHYLQKPLDISVLDRILPDLN